MTPEQLRLTREKLKENEMDTTPTETRLQDLRLSAHEAKALTTIALVIQRHVSDCTGASIASVQLALDQTGDGRLHPRLFCMFCTLSLS